MATTDKLQKREKSRRVWRLNKREGVPVLEALEAVDISKDVYYRLKNQYEEKWQNEIITAEGLENKLQELDRRAEELEEKIEDRDEGVQTVYNKINEIKQEKRFYDSVRQMEEEMSRVRYLLKENDVDLSEVGDGEEEMEERPEIKEIHNDLDELNKRTGELNSQLEEIKETQESMKDKVEFLWSVRDDRRESNSDSESLLSQLL
jgi:DNA repair ATPase RecN